MDAKQLTPILLVVQFACLAFSPKSEGGGDVETSAGGLRRWPDGEEMVASSKIYIVLCVKYLGCKPDMKTCYCCQTLKNKPCYTSHKQCMDICPNRRLQQAPALRMTSAPAAAVASSIIEEQRRSRRRQQ